MGQIVLKGDFCTITGASADDDCADALSFEAGFAASAVPMAE
jgi:hypothetical protein